jgi:hypothetical protein
MPVSFYLLDHPSMPLVYNTAVLLWGAAMLLVWNKATQDEP